MEYTIKDGEFFKIKDPKETQFIKLSSDSVLATSHDVEIISETEFLENSKTLKDDTERD